MGLRPMKTIAVVIVLAVAAGIATHSFAGVAIILVLAGTVSVLEGWRR